MFNRKRDYNAAYVLTPKGKQKADDATAEGTTYDVLNHLSDHGLSTVSEIAQAHGYPARNLEHHMQQMAKRGYIDKVGDKELE